MGETKLVMTIGIDGNEANIQNRVGSGEYCFELLRNLDLLQEDKIFVYLKERVVPDLPKSSKNLSYRVFGPRIFWTQFALPLNLYFKKPTPDVFYTPGHYAPRFCPVPVVITIFDLSYIHFPELFKKKDLYQLRSWTSYSIRKAKAILTISNSSKADIIKHYKVDPKKVFVTYPGYDEKIFKPVTDPKSIILIKRKYDIKGKYVFFLGTIQPRKNLVRLIEAIKQLENVNLVIAGKKGWLYDEFFQKIEEPEVKNRIILTNFIPDSDLPVLFSGAEAFVLPSLWEGFGIPVVEAMACGCPVVVSDKSSLPEVIGNNGVLINPENVASIRNGIQKVLTNKNFAQELSTKGLIQAKKFSWKRCANKTLEILENTVNSKN